MKNGFFDLQIIFTKMNIKAKNILNVFINRYLNAFFFNLNGIFQKIFNFFDETLRI